MTNPPSSGKRKLFIGIILVIFGSLVGYSYLNGTAKVVRPSIHTIPIAPVSEQDHIRGNPEARVTIVEYSDFECPSCIYFQPTIRQIMQAYGDKIRWIVRFYPLPQHANAEKEAEAAECVASLGSNTAFWKFSDDIFNNIAITEDGTGLSLGKLPEFAQSVGVKRAVFQKCLDSQKYSDKIHDTVTNAAAANIQQFPSTIIISPAGNMQLVVSNQPFGVYKSIIDQDLND